MKEFVGTIFLVRVLCAGLKLSIHESETRGKHHNIMLRKGHS